MKHLTLSLVLLLLPGCAREVEEVPLAEWEVADLQAARYDFRAYPGSIYREDQTKLLERAHFLLNPGASEAPPTLVLESSDPLDEVAVWYATSNGYEGIAPEQTPEAHAWYRSGRLGDDAAAAAPLFEKLSLGTRVSAATGDYRAANIAPTARLPRITVQRPWFDALTSRVVDSTLIVLVRDEPQFFTPPETTGTASTSTDVSERP